jgi:diacylglycerol kinase family enzyme
MGDKVVILANRGSGSFTPEAAQGLRKKAEQLGLDAELRLLEAGNSATAIARRILDEGTTTIAVAAGDGTLRGVAQVLAGTSARLLPLPGGTFNHFARDLGINGPPPRPLELLVMGETRMVDVGEVNGHIFLNNSSLGLYPTLVSQRQREQQLGKNRWEALLVAGFAALRRYPSATVRLSAGGKELLRRTPVVFVGNNEYQMEGLRIGRRERLDGGKLCVYVLQGHGGLALLRYLGRSLVGRLYREDDFDYLSTQAVTIESHHSKMKVALDGEVMRLAPPLQYKIRPRALRVVAPKTTDRTKAA